MKAHRNPQRARSYRRALAQRVAASQNPSTPRPHRAFKGTWPELGTVLVCESHASLVGAVPATQVDHFTAEEMSCYICLCDLANEQPTRRAA